MSRLRRAALATVVVQLFSMLGLVLSFVTVPLYLTWLGSERYGLMLTAQACAGYLAFSDAGLSWSSMLLISHAHGRDDRAEIARIVRSSLTLAGISALVVAVLTLTACLLLRYQSTFLPLPASNPESVGLALAIGLQVIVALGCSPIYNVFIGLQESHLSALYQGLGRVLGVGASLWVAARGMPPGAVVAAGTMGPLAGGLGCAIHTRLRHPWALVRGAFWDRAQARQQYRTGAKSFGLQIGRVLVSSAPVLAISTQAGASFVPGFTVALTLLNTPLSVITSFNANLQAGYGEAVGRQDFPWIRATVQTIIRNMLLVQALLAVGFMVLARTTIVLWTHGRLHVPWLLLFSALIVGLLNSTLIALQYALSGTNRHKVAGVSEIFNGLFCLGLSLLVVHFAGYEWVGFGILGGAAATSAWILPTQIKKHLGIDRLRPPGRFLAAILTAAGAAALAGYYTLDGLHAAAPRLPWLSLVGAGLVIAGGYLGVLRVLLPTDAQRLVALWQQLRRKRPLPVPAASALVETNDTA